MSLYSYIVNMKKRFLSLFLTLVLILQVFTLLSCERNKNKYTAYSIDFFDTATSVTGYAKNRKTFDKVTEEIFSVFEEYHKLSNIYQRYDGLANLCTVNDLKDGQHECIKVDSRLIDMLLYAKEMYNKTNGNVNIAMGSVLSIWHNYRTFGIDDPSSAQLPKKEKLEAARDHMNIDDIIIDEENSTVFIKDPKLTIDVGAIAKGYAVEMAARMLEEKGIEGYVINAGGNVRTVGLKGDGTKWVAGITNPDEDSDDSYIAYLDLSGEALVTSGSYQRFYIVNGKSYHHIIDPETLMPAEGYLSVSIVAKSSAEADALSTALFCMSFKEGYALIESLPDVEAFWALSDGSFKESSGFSLYLSDKY